MQSQYGVSEIQQFMVEGGYAPLFSIPTSDTHSPSQPQKHHLHAHQPQQQQQQQHHHHLQQPQQQHPHHHHHHHHGQHLHLHHHHPPQLQVMPGQPQLQHFHTIPMTQQLFQQTHQFHLFQQEQESRMQQQQAHLGLDQPPGTVKVPPFMGPVNFKLSADESAGGGGSGDGLKEEGGVQGDDGSESRLHPWSTAGEEESAIKEPFWRPMDVDYINRNNNNNNNKRCREKQLDPPNGGKHSKASTSRQGNDVEDGNNNNNSANYKLFSELEAIYKPGGSSFGGGHRNTHHHTAPTSTPPPAAAEPGPDDDPVTETADQGSNASTAEEAAPAPMPDNKSTARKRKRKQQLSSMAGFLEGLVKRLMEHQEGLHRKFLELLERRDQEKTNREEAWRQQEAARASREATARAREQALASGREAAIISFLEKLTGECLNLPTKAEFQSQLQEEAAMAPHMGTDTTAPVVANSSVRGLVNSSSSSRWPKAEVQALIRVRSGLEWRFQEPGLKGPLWEEVSSAMAAVGYHRSSKRCKEKWENINKYFRKSKGNAKKRPQHSKTCPYFHQLDQLYSGPLCPGRRDGQAPPNAIAVSDGQSAAAALDDDENNDGGEEEEEEEEDEGGEEGEEEVGGEGERPEHTGGV